MTPENVQQQIHQLQALLWGMDNSHRQQFNKYTPVEVSDALKALRMLSLSLESGGLHTCFVDAA